MSSMVELVKTAPCANRLANQNSMFPLTIGVQDFGVLYTVDVPLGMPLSGI